MGTLSRIDFADGGHNYFAYDADSKRVSKRDGDGFTEFVYQGPDMLKLFMVRDEQGETQAHYTMGQGLEAMRRANGDGIASGDSSFYHYNHLGTTQELTDADETVTDTYRHDAWGVPLARTGSTLNPHTYVGRERYYRMPEAILYHLGFRDYAPRLGRFTTLDPLLALREGQSRDAYLYVSNSPGFLTDPSGKLWVGGLLRGSAVIDGQKYPVCGYGVPVLPPRGADPQCWAGFLDALEWPAPTNATSSYAVLWWVHAALGGGPSGARPGAQG